MSYMTLSSHKNPLFQKEFLDDTFFTLFIFSHASDNTTQNIGERMHGPSPTSNFGWGTVPSVPLGVRPWSGSYSFGARQEKQIRETVYENNNYRRLIFKLAEHRMITNVT